MNLLSDILEKANNGKAPDKQECLYLLSLPPEGDAAKLLRTAANTVMRRKFTNKVLLLGQIGIENHPCPADCFFCGFRESGNIVREKLPIDEITRKTKELTESGHLQALFLMAMHDYDFSYLLKVCEAVKSLLPATTDLVVNIGDSAKTQFAELKAAGVNGAYHVLRLGEGNTTKLSPLFRRESIRYIRETNLNWYTCCEPIGPEHSDSELIEQIFLGREFGCFQHAAMDRVNLPASPLAKFGSISKTRLAQIVAVISLSCLEIPELQSIAVHEPDMLSLSSGANSLYAESGANPRDVEKDTGNGRGYNLGKIIDMCRQAGFIINNTLPS